ncbi:tRNA (uridine(54)-C5)-methyltransferase TrmA [Anaerobiospirillum sp. NML120449]|uniref:tRNA (uridine(54)-C5)-methyltransferase TrmA n=1 Tax=Anaerobiospirillum sp. NML120449 TaxID=2932817 RepID=UPI001FF41F74|nr:tRNA (uridine(54)-C5)-methyltransferase TrmA [Anaerobiospirillum sp. NML120449]MCK0526948.1 tRNA (uridine(54)-C5)-methyltransferase TrmA [Anaerobiospirillum sp. NML120449]
MLPVLLTTTDKDNYQAYLDEKVTRVFGMLKETLQDSDDLRGYEDLCGLTPEVHASIPEHYRMRAEFSVFHHNDGTCDYAMYEPGSKPRKIILIKDFPGCTVSINRAMAALRELLPEYPLVKRKLFGADFLSNSHDDVVISLNYHKKLDEAWQEEAQGLYTRLNEQGLSISFVAHARKQAIVIGKDHVIETIPTTRGDIRLKQVEGTFSQPNATACSAMLNFALSCAQDGIDEAKAKGQKARDLIELYCGSGTFTVTLAPLFPRVFATEVARLPAETAVFNMQLNGVDNISMARLSALEVTEALTHVRTFRRLQEKEINLDDFDFGTLLIDPPRAGLNDEEALKFTSSYDRVIYISCGPESLASDLKYLTRTHRIARLAFFDQFPYTSHMESGVLLIRR